MIFYICSRCTVFFVHFEVDPSFFFILFFIHFGFRLFLLPSHFAKKKNAKRNLCNRRVLLIHGFFDYMRPTNLLYVYVYKYRIQKELEIHALKIAKPARKLKKKTRTHRDRERMYMKWTEQKRNNNKMCVRILARNAKKVRFFLCALFLNM